MKHTFVLFLFLFSCSKERQNPVVSKPLSCDSIAFTFNKDILPIFSSYCNFSACHSSEDEGGYDFTKYNVVANRVRAGTLDYRIDLPYDDPQHMPEGLRLNPCDYYIIKTWIRQNFPQ